MRLFVAEKGSVGRIRPGSAVAIVASKHPAQTRGGSSPDQMPYAKRLDVQPKRRAKSVSSVLYREYREYRTPKTTPYRFKCLERVESSMAIGDKGAPWELLDEGDQRTVQEVGGDSLGITLDQDLVDKGDTVFILDTGEDNVKKLVLPPVND